MKRYGFINVAEETSDSLRKNSAAASRTSRSWSWVAVGRHDRPWFERPVFGQVRYMSFASTGRKFDSKSYMAQIGKLERADV
jgi:hypothetical protein